MAQRGGAGGGLLASGEEMLASGEGGEEGAGLCLHDRHEVRQDSAAEIAESARVQLERPATRRPCNVDVTWT